MTKQRVWQKRMQAAGRCPRCGFGLPPNRFVMCLACRLKRVVIDAKSRAKRRAAWGSTASANGR